MIKIDGNRIGREIVDSLKKQPSLKKTLAAVLADNDPASLSFLKRKEAVAGELAIDFKLYHLEKSVSQKKLENKIEEICADNSVGGVIIQLPLPKKYNQGKVLSKLDPEKDIDNLTGRSAVKSPVVAAVEDILADIKWNPANQLVAVVGRGFLIGRPVISWLAEKNMTYKSADINTKNIRNFLADADLVISGVGKAGLIKAGWLKRGAGIIDFGFPADFNPANYSHLAFFTPTPGGTGPVLVAEVFRNFYKLNQD